MNIHKELPLSFPGFPPSPDPSPPFTQISRHYLRRLRAGWTAEFEEWSQRRLEGREVVYVWADGIYVKAGLERDKAALLVVLGAMRDGTKRNLSTPVRHSWESIREQSPV